MSILQNGYLTFILSLIMIHITINDVNAQKVEVSFKEKLVLGEDEKAPLEYQFAGPSGIITDSHGKIYIAGTANTIRVFSPEGEYLNTIGGRGRGPGEFLDISAMALGMDNEIIVSDKRAFRITYFYNFGDSIETFSPKEWNTMVGRKMVQSNIVPIQKNLIAITSKESDAYYGRPVEEMDNRVIHLMSKDFSTFHKSFFDVYEYMFDPENPIERKFATNWDYSLVKLSEGKLAISHKMFNGIVYVIDLSKEEGDIRMLKGNFLNKNVYEILEGSSSRPYLNSKYGLVSSSGPLGRFVYQTQLGSLGLFANESWLMNFVFTIKGKKGEYFIEFFTPEGEYKGYTNIDDDFSIQDGMRRRFYPMHLDEKNQLYYVDYSTKNPTVKVVEIIVED